MAAITIVYYNCSRVAIYVEDRRVLDEENPTHEILLKSLGYTVASLSVDIRDMPIVDEQSTSIESLEQLKEQIIASKKKRWRYEINDLRSKLDELEKGLEL